MKNQHKLLLAPVWLFFVGITIFATHAQAQRAEDIVFTPDRAKTIPGHGMSKGEYPYDEAGKYQTDWVSVSAKSSVKSSTTVKDPIPKDSKDHPEFSRRIAKKAEEKLAKIEKKTEPEKEVVRVKNEASSSIQKVAYHPTQKTEIKQAEPEIHTLSFIGPYAKMIGLHRQNTSASPEKEATSDDDRETVYHRVVSGDTLFNISRKYGTTVEALKKVNGLTSDLIKVGQSLRLTIAQQALRLPKG